MFNDVIIEQNPHWGGILYDHGIERSYFPKFLDYLETGMIISVIGVRRAGKSTIIKQAINHLIVHKKISPKNILFLNLEHPYFSAYSHDVGYLQKIYDAYIKLVGFPKDDIYVMLDEVQFFQGWQVFVKAHYEQKKIHFVLTGSNSALLSSDLMTLLSGRTLFLEIFPLAFHEIVKANNIDTDDQISLTNHRHELSDLMMRFLKFGGFPGVVLDLMPSVAYDILNAYAKTILFQDVAPRLQLRKSMELERLFVYLISNIGKLFSYSNLSELLDLSDKVIKDYIEAFSDSYLLFELEMFDFSLKKQIRNPKKMYSIDPGQVNAVAFHFTENLGRLLENVIFLELRRSGLEVYYYKTNNNLEIDFLAKRTMKLALVQVALDISKPATLLREKKALLQAMAELKLNKGIIITHDYQETEELADTKITLMPAHIFCCLSFDQKIELLGL